MKAIVCRLSIALRPLLPGLTLVALAGALILLAGQLPVIRQSGFSSLVLAILAGMLLGNTFYLAIAPGCQSGVGWLRHYGLRWGIMLYGFRISLQEITALGPAVLLIDLVMLASTFMLACWLGIRCMGLKRESVWLIGAGSSICGAAAVIATSMTLHKPDSRDVAVAIATVVTFGTLAMFLYPWLYHWLAGHWDISPSRFGIYIGSTVHEVAQVVAAGEAISPQAGEAAVIAKMVRVMLLAPFLLLLAGWVQRSPDGNPNRTARLPVPWFAVVFLLIAVFNSMDLLQPAVRNFLVRADEALLMLAMFALGLETRWQAIRRAGLRPLLLAGLLMTWLVMGGAAVNYSLAILF